MMNELKTIEAAGIIPVVVLEDAAHALHTAIALSAGGVQVMEITLRTPAALEAIALAATQPQMLVGAGTVLTLDQCKRSVEAGARFIVSPGLSREIVGWCLENGITVLPGCATPTEIMAARDMGIHAVKFFPANIYGGASALKTLSGPFGDVRFVPTGGIDGQNLAQYSTLPAVLAVGGSWMCSKADIAAGHFEKITALCRDARAIWGREGL